MLKLDLQIDSLIEQIDNMSKEIEMKIDRAVKGLVAQTHAFIVQEAKTKLHSTLQTYLDNLSEPEEISEGLFVITLKEPALFIEEGRPAGSMRESFLASPKAKFGANGKYLRVPFIHAGAKTAQGNIKKQTPLQSTLADTIKNELKAL